MTTAPALAVLCGGESRRFPGGKLSADFHGEPLLLRVLRRLEGAAHLQLLAGHPPGTLNLPRGWEVVPDPAPGLGPLAALVAIARRAPGGFLTAGGDMPFLHAAPLARLWTALGTHRVAAVRGPEGLHPMLLAVGPELASELAARPLSERLPGPRVLLSAGGVREVSLTELGVEPGLAGHFLEDVDTPAQLEVLVGLA